MNSQPPLAAEDRESWDEHELVHLAVEMFRQRDRVHSSQSLRYPAAQILFDTLSNEAIQPHWQPNWDELVLPNGRTVSSCRRIFHSFQRRSAGPSSGVPFAQGPTSFSLPTSAAVSRKRSLPAETLNSIIGRPLAPKQPASFPADTRALLTGHQAHHPPSPLGEPAPALNEPRKKRGRPTKKEQEERRRRHAERSQTQPSPGLMSPYGPQLPHVPPPAVPVDGSSSILAGPQLPTAVMATPRTLPADGENNSSSSSGKKRRGRPPKLPSQAETDPLSQPSFVQQASSAYSSPPISASFTASTREQRTSISTRSAAAGPRLVQREQREESEESRLQPRQRSWNDTVLGTSIPPQP